MTNDPAKQEVDLEALQIPQFINNRNRNRNAEKSPKNNELKFIKLDEGNLNKKHWKILKELDGLIGLTLSEQDEPKKIIIKYSLLNSSDNTVERIKRIIKIKK